MKTAVINIKTDPQLKTKAQKVAAELGFSLSSLINAYLKQLTKTKTITFSAVSKNLSANIQQISVRLKPGQDLRREIESIAEDYKVKAGCIVNIVGSLSKARLRMAGAKETKVWDGEFEIVSGGGTVSQNTTHIHLSISDSNGDVYGGHLKDDCIVRTTVELVVLIFDDVIYDVAPDEATGYDELIIRSAK